MSEKGYKPIKHVMDQALFHLGRADDIGYILNYWQLVGSCSSHQVPYVETTPNIWHSGLKIT